MKNAKKVTLNLGKVTLKKLETVKGGKPLMSDYTCESKGLICASGKAYCK